MKRKLLELCILTTVVASGLSVETLARHVKPVINGDQYIGPVIGFDDAHGRDSDDIRRITANYQGPPLRIVKTNSTNIGVDFTLYPDGKIRWLRPCGWLNGAKEPETDQLCEAMSKALAKSGPLRLATAASVKASQPCALILSKNASDHDAILHIAFYSSCGDTRFVLVQSTLPTDQLDWLIDDSNRIKSVFKESSARQDRKMAAIWFRLNPDGGIESCMPVSIEHSKNFEREIDTALCDALRKAVPLRYLADPKDPGGPRGLVLIYSHESSMSITLRTVSYLSPVHQISIGRASDSCVPSGLGAR